MIWLLLLIIFSIFTYIVYKKYTTWRYNIMMKKQIIKIYFKQNDLYFLNVLNKLHTYTTKTLTLFNSNLIIQELLQNSRIPIKFLLLFKHVLNGLNELILYIIKQIKK